MKWALVEAMGHRSFGGQVEEVTRFGGAMCRVHVPEFVATHTEDERAEDGYRRTGRTRTVTERWPGFAIDLAYSALYGVTEVSEARARDHRGHRVDGPVTEYGPWTAAAALPGPVEDAEVVDDGRPYDPRSRHPYTLGHPDDECCCICGEVRDDENGLHEPINTCSQPGCAAPTWRRGQSLCEAHWDDANDFVDGEE